MGDNSYLSHLDSKCIKYLDCTAGFCQKKNTCCKCHTLPVRWSVLTWCLYNTGLPPGTAVVSVTLPHSNYIPWLSKPSKCMCIGHFVLGTACTFTSTSICKILCYTLYFTLKKCTLACQTLKFVWWAVGPQHENNMQDANDLGDLLKFTLHP